MERRWHWGINSLRFWFVSSSKIMYYHMDECMKYSEKHEGKGALFSYLISLPCPPALCSCSLCSNFRLTDSEQQALFRRGGAGRCNEARHMFSGCVMWMCDAPSFAFILLLLLPPTAAQCPCSPPGRFPSITLGAHQGPHTPLPGSLPLNYYHSI